MSRPSVFISYSHRDEEWKDRLVAQLEVLHRQGLVDLWDDRRIETGTDWYQEIQKAMDDADVAVLLVSADFLNSDFIFREEVPRILERRQRERLIVLPIIVRPCAWQKVEWLARMQVLPKDGKPLSTEDNGQIETQLAAIAEEIVDIVNRHRQKPSSWREWLIHLLRFPQRWNRSRQVAILLGLLVFVVIPGVYFYRDLLPSGLQEMEGVFNVAIADFGEQDRDGEPVRASADGKKVSDFIFEGLKGNLDEQEDNELGRIVELRHEGIDYIKGAIAAERELAVKKLADEINATIVIYGTLRVGSPPYSFVPQFYVTDQFRGGEELIGENAFGESIDFLSPLSNQRKLLVLTEKLEPRLKALIFFTWGLAYFLVDSPSKAWPYLTKAEQVDGWSDAQGKEVLYLFKGSTLRELGADRFEEARENYKRALGFTDGQYARAYIGLGNLLLDQGTTGKFVTSIEERFQNDLDSGRISGDLRSQFEESQSGERGRLSLSPNAKVWILEENRKWLVTEGCSKKYSIRKKGTRLDFYMESIIINFQLVDAAIEQYEQALTATLKPPTAYVDIKAYFNLGLAATYKAQYMGDRCSNSDAVDALKNAIALCEGRDANLTLIQELRARSHYQLGLVYEACGDQWKISGEANQAAEHYELAAKEYQQSIDMATPEMIGQKVQEESWHWQGLPWIAYHRLAYTYLARAEMGQSDLYEAAESNDEIVVGYHERSGMVARDVIAEAYYNLGLAKEQLGRKAQAVENYARAQQIAPTGLQLYIKVEEKLRLLSQGSE